MGIGTERPLRVLLVEDDDEDYLITRDMLERQERARFELDWAPSYELALSAIAEQRHDAYLVDYRLGERTGLELVRNGFAQRAPAPVILLTGRSDYEIDLEATALGVTDYLVKQEINEATLERSIRYAVSHHRALADLATSEERFALAVRGANDGIWDWNLVSDAIYLSPRWHEILGGSAIEGEIAPSALFEMVHPDDAGELRRLIDRHLDGESPHLFVEHRMRTQDGGWRWVLTRGVAIRDTNGRATRIAGSMSDVTERRAAVERLRHDALHDSLTGLPNRTLLLDRLEQALRRRRRGDEGASAVLFVDVDRFKMVNDSLSHSVGDRLLQEIAQRLLAVVRPADTVARIGGDEFTLLIEGVDGEAEALEVGRRLLEGFAKPFEISGHSLQVTASVGVALSRGQHSATELLRDADIAMYEAKHAGRGLLSVFDQGMRRQIVDRLERETYLRRALEDELVGVCYQPIVDLATGMISSFEALARWPTTWPEVGPGEFVPVAEEIGLIGELGSHVLRAALLALARWRRAGLVDEDVCVSVNVSTRQLDDPNLPLMILGALEEAGVPPSALRLEITESSLMGRPEVVARTVTKICDEGVGLHLDDFGTGYSSLSALYSFPVRALKIDRSFVSSMLGDATAGETIVRSTVALAHSLGLIAIAEGIEQPEQLRRVAKLGCDAGQGFLLGHPLPAEQTEELLRHWRPAAVGLLR